MLVSSATRRRIIRCIGAAALLPSVVTTILFILYSMSTSIRHSALPVVCIISTILQLASCFLITIFTVWISQRNYSYRLCGAMPSLLAGITSAITLGWMNIRKQDLPSTIAGRDSMTMVVAGFAVFVITAIAQTIFWTTLLLSSAVFGTITHNIALNSTKSHTHARKPSKPADLHSLSPPPNSYRSTVFPSATKESRRISFKSQLFTTVKSKSGRRGSGSSALDPASSSSKSPTPPPSSPLGKKSPTPEPTINHFDTWETSDLSLHSQVAASLAEVERETLAEASRLNTENKGNKLTMNTRGLGIHHHRLSLPSPILEQDVQIRAVERQCSPPLPENEDCTPRTFTFPRAGVTSPRTMPPGGGGMVSPWSATFGPRTAPPVPGYTAQSPRREREPAYAFSYQRTTTA